DLWMQCYHNFRLLVRVFPVPHAIDYHLCPIHFKQDAVISNAQPILRSEVCQLLHVASQVLLQRFSLGHDAVVFCLRQRLQVFKRSRLEFDLIIHPCVSSSTSRAEAVWDVVVHFDWLAVSRAWSLLQTASNSAGSFSFSIRK